MRDKPRNEILERAWLHVTARQATVVAAISIYTPTWLMSHRKINAFECLFLPCVWRQICRRRIWHVAGWLGWLWHATSTPLLAMWHTHP